MESMSEPSGTGLKVGDVSACFVEGLFKSLLVGALVGDEVPYSQALPRQILYRTTSNLEQEPLEPVPSLNVTKPPHPALLDALQIVPLHLGGGMVPGIEGDRGLPVLNLSKDPYELPLANSLVLRDLAPTNERALKVVKVPPHDQLEEQASEELLPLGIFGPPAMIRSEATSGKLVRLDEE